MSKKSDNETQLELSDIVESVDEGTLLVGDTNVELPPSIGDTGWNSYVMKQFEEDELFDGSPTVDGLRRVTSKLIGKITTSMATVIESPNLNNGLAATVQHTVIIRDYEGDELTFTEVTNIDGNNTDAEFAKFASATASTIAEGRALRKALQLRKILSHEEISSGLKDDDGRKIDRMQIKMIDTVAKRIDGGKGIDVVKMMKSSKEFKFTKIGEVPHNAAAKLIQALSTFQASPEKIPDKIRGYKENWAEEKSEE